MPHPPNETETFHHLGDDGVTRLTFKREFLGPVAALASLLTADAAIKIPAAFAVRGVPTALTRSQGHAFFRLPVTKIQLNTHFKTIAPGVLSPCWVASTDSVAMNLEWALPADMQIVLGVEAAPDGDRWYMVQMFFAAQKPGTPGFFRLPLPNVYQDSRVCLGNRDTIFAATLAEMADVLLARFEAAPWNADLLVGETDRVAAGRELFRFTSSTGAVIPHGVADWTTTLAVRTSHANLEKFL